MPETKAGITFNEAIQRAMYEEMVRDDSVILIGTSAKRGSGGRHLSDTFGADRLIEAPIAEQGFTCGGLGAALMGLRPIVTFGRGDFLYCAMDSIANEAAKYRYMCGGDPFRVPMVLKVQSFGMGGGAGAQHVQHVEATFMHFPGLKVVAPSTPLDAYGLLKSAIRDDNPVIFLEHKGLKQSGATEELPDDEDFLVPLGQAAVRTEGDDVTVIAYANMVEHSLEAARRLGEEGVHVEVIDLRTLLPWDVQTVVASVEKTGRVVTVTEDVRTGGVGSEIAATIVERTFPALKAPVHRVSYPDMIPPSTVYGESQFRVTAEDVVAGIRKVMEVG